MSEIHFHITQGRIENEMTLEMLSAAQNLQDGAIPWRTMRDMMTLFMVDEQGQYLEQQAACLLLNPLKGEQLAQTVRTFSSAFEEYLLPKTSGAQSSSPSKPAGDSSRDGATS